MGAQLVAQNSGWCSMGVVGAQNDNTRYKEPKCSIRNKTFESLKIEFLIETKLVSISDLL